MCSTLTTSDSESPVTDFSLCELAGETESLIRAQYPLRNLRHYLEVYPCPDFETNRASAAAWLKKLSVVLKAEQRVIGIKSSYVLVPSIDVSRTLAPQCSMREGTGFLQSCSRCGTPLSQLDRSCPACRCVDPSPRDFEGKTNYLNARICAPSRQSV